MRKDVLIQKLSRKEIPFIETHNIEEVEKLGFFQLPVIKYNEEYYSSDGSSSAKDWIIQRESGGNYNATNGQYYGAYQLDKSYLNGDYSKENQDRTAEQYVANRYGSWEAAQEHWKAHGWY